MKIIYEIEFTYDKDDKTVSFLFSDIRDAEAFAASFGDVLKSMSKENKTEFSVKRTTKRLIDTPEEAIGTIMSFLNPSDEQITKAMDDVFEITPDGIKEKDHEE